MGDVNGEKDLRDGEYDDSAASSGPEDAEVQEHQQDKAEDGAAQGGKGRVQ